MSLIWGKIFYISISWKIFYISISWLYSELARIKTGLNSILGKIPVSLWFNAHAKSQTLTFVCLMYVFLQNAHLNQLSSKGGRRWIPCHLSTATLMISDYEHCPIQLPGFGMKYILLVVLPTGTTIFTGPGRMSECCWHSCPPECALSLTELLYFCTSQCPSHLHLWIPSVFDHRICNGWWDTAVGQQGQTLALLVSATLFYNVSFW